MRAHPRSRGENLIPTVMQLSSVGSSPLTRGKLEDMCGVSLSRGLIPAHAGKTPTGARGPASCRAHPRSRGENRWGRGFAGREAGSSPLTRGKRLASRVCIVIRGLIPAHAGKTVLRVLRAGACAAHPRSRGENHPPQAGTRRYHGSSPLTRGKLHLRGVRPRVRGLIPAHAGKTARRAHIHDLGAAHPRSRGENASIADRRSRARGSSPLTRGKRDTSVFVTQVIRLIPAHAGKTGRRESIIWLARAHPRSPGENDQAGIEPPGGAGSSPLTRGKHGDHGAIACLAGLIPAHAGKTTVSISAPPAYRAHPRSRGENFQMGTPRSASWGSSPLTRGKPPLPDWYQAVPRLIPAHAGKT